MKNEELLSVKSDFGELSRVVKSLSAVALAKEDAVKFL
jgi:hypothetical protein